MMGRGREWKVSEERFIEEHFSDMTYAEIAEALGRSASAVTQRAAAMQAQGRLERKYGIREIRGHVTDAKLCRECMYPRFSLNHDGVCRVCRHRGQLARHTEKMHRAYANLPQELKDRTNGSFAVERNEALMKEGTVRASDRPRRPDTSGMERFWADAAMDSYWRSMEDWEDACVLRDIDAVKQRASKWNRKAASWRARHGS